MKKLCLYVLLCILFNANFTLKAEDVPVQERILKNRAAWTAFAQENEINFLLKSLSGKNKPQTYAIVNVNLISMSVPGIQTAQTIVIENGLFKEIGAAQTVQIPENSIRIDGSGKYLIPGLSDMHVHSLISNSQKLLNLATGVTTVRDMCGFDWLLEEKKKIAKNEMLAPNQYVAGQILNSMPMSFYARVVKTPDEARLVVKEQAADGYDFIKVHNVLPVPVWEAIIDEAKNLKMDVVGHVPHEVKLEDAIRKGQRTIEHFKGYYSDRSLELTSEDYVSLTKGSGVWLCPTFYNYRGEMFPDQAKQIAALDEMKYAPKAYRDRWLSSALQSDGETSSQKVLRHSIKIFGDLVPVHSNFIAGTDSGGGYSFMVPGFSLLEELELMAKYGLSAEQALRSATQYAAEAMRKSKEFGTIEPAKRADCVLLDANPLESISNIRKTQGVMVRGIWLSSATIQDTLKRIEMIYSTADSISNQANVTTIRKIVSDLIALRKSGFGNRRDAEPRLIEMLHELGLNEEAASVKNLLAH